MTREEAKEILTHNWTRVDNPNYSESELDEAFFMAIEALSADAVQGGDAEVQTIAKTPDYMQQSRHDDGRMTRELAIRILSTRDAHGVLCGYTSGVTEALDMAIKALQSEVVMCKDCKWRKKNKFCLEHNRYEKNDDGYCHYGERGTYERK